MSESRPASSDSDEVDVVIVGGGPGGVSLAYLLGKYGVRTVVFEKEKQPPASPRGQHAHPTTAELWRAWGVLERLEKVEHGVGWDLHRQKPESFWGSIDSGALLRYPSVQQQADEVRLLAAITPEDRVLSATYQYAPLIAEAASQFEHVEVLPGFAVTELSQNADGVWVAATGPGGVRREITARYAVGADGQRSTVRQQLGIERSSGALRVDPQAAIWFAGEVDAVGETGFMNHVFGLGRRAYLARTPYHPADGADAPQRWHLVFHHEGDPLSVEEQRRLVAQAVGREGFSFEILGIEYFPITSSLATEWRRGRVFLLGDSAHSHSPWNGYGQNLAAAEANNLAWKLASVIRGEAGEVLLDTYQDERSPAAANIIRLTTFNDGVLKLLEQSYLELREFDEDERQVRLFFPAFAGQLGKNDVYFEFGERYWSAAVLDDGRPAELGTDKDDYRRTGTPGGRAPHVWLNAAGKARTSTRALLGDSWVLFADDPDAAWSQAAAAWPGTGVASLAVHAVGPGQEWTPDEDWFEVTGVEERGALLVRPDGFIAARLAAPANGDPAAVLHDALRALHGLQVSTAPA